MHQTSLSFLAAFIPGPEALAVEAAFGLGAAVALAAQLYPFQVTTSNLHPICKRNTGFLKGNEIDTGFLFEMSVSTQSGCQASTPALLAAFLAAASNLLWQKGRSMTHYPLLYIHLLMLIYWYDMSAEFKHVQTKSESDSNTPIEILIYLEDGMKWRTEEVSANWRLSTLMDWSVGCQQSCRDTSSL